MDKVSKARRQESLPGPTSSSRSSNTVINSCGTNSLKPAMNALNWSCTRRWIRHSVLSSTYSALFSFVTGILRPLGFKSTTLRSPKISSSTENVSSRIPVMSFSLLADCCQACLTAFVPQDSQHPRETAEEVRVDAFHVLRRNLFPKDHFVKRTDEKGVEEPVMENGESNHPAYEFEMVQMVGVNGTVRINL